MREIDLDALAGVLQLRGQDGRHITGIAGPPGSGKSTVAERLAGALNAVEAGSAEVVPMDGYHFDDAILEARGWRPRKGAPHTFDVGGFAAMLERLAANAEEEIAVPVFDRSIEIARNAARFVPRSVRHLIVEGNYLLLDEAPWSDLRFDTTVFLDVPMAEVERRLLARWERLTDEELRVKMEENDLPNARCVAEGSREADFVVRNV